MTATHPDDPAMFAHVLQDSDSFAIDQVRVILGRRGNGTGFVEAIVPELLGDEVSWHRTRWEPNGPMAPANPDERIGVRIPPEYAVPLAGALLAYAGQEDPGPAAILRQQLDLANTRAVLAEERAYALANRALDIAVAQPLT